ncbi:MAG: SET domain-containing protein-lysine N-methyltransferase [Chlamydiales bacterium]|nr:SET domain-containing protein-lysine N-methyltransferase [Chlamydiales bacterium]
MNVLTDDEYNLLLLNHAPYHKDVKVVRQGLPIVQQLDFEQFCGIPYLKHIGFKSRPLLDLVIAQCPWTFRFGYHVIHEDYHFYRDQIWKGTVADITIAWIGSGLGYGIYANQNFEKDTFIGTYTGVVRHLDRSRPDHNVYCLHYPTRYWSYEMFIIDAELAGNEMRFANHSKSPNMNLECLCYKGLLFFFLRANQPICKGSELTFDYGEAFWRERVQLQVCEA